nr:PQQ-binding-like beta-propeller repeat protein [Planctomycetota bacterium]
MFRFDFSTSLVSSLLARRALLALLLVPGLIGSVMLQPAMAQQEEAPTEEATPADDPQVEEAKPPKEAPKEEPAKKDPAKKPTDPKPVTKPAPKPEKPPVAVPEEAEADEAVPEEAEAEGDEPKPKPKPARPNPVQQIFKNIFQGRGIIPIRQPRPANPKLIPGANGPVKPNDPNKPKENGEITLDTIDRRAPVENRQTALYERALRAAANEEWNLVIEVAEALFNPRAFPHDTLIRRKDGTLVSIRREAIALIGRVPEQYRRVYVEEFAKVAEAMLAEAVANGDTRQMVEGATRYFWTPSGPKAADVLATRHLDRGEFTIAADWLEQLLSVKSPITETASWKKKAAVAFRMAGREALADQLKVDTIDPNLLGERIATTKPRSVEEWPLLFGNSRRFSVGVGSAPVLLKRWTLPTTWNRPLEKKIDEMIDGFTDSNRATLPAPMPLLVNGKIICRTFRGVQVADAATGKPLWSTGGSSSVEAMLTGQMDNVQMQMAWNGNPGFFLQQSSSTNSSGGPLGQLMFQNAARGLLSSDGHRLYVIEDTPLFTLNRTSMRFGRRQNTNVFRGNRLKAYDLETGRPLWEAGGPASIEEFALPLSGHFFMGAPVADGGELFVITEDDSEIRLQSLDPDTGHPNWSQPIAYAEKRIDQDP